MKILDATAGSRGIWYQKNLPFVTFMDKRKGRFVFYPNPKTKRTFDINPDVVADWTKRIPFDDDFFDMVVFDPPHLIVSKQPKSDFQNAHPVWLSYERYLETSIIQRIR